jgi:hypothetical protein
VQYEKRVTASPMSRCKHCAKQGMSHQSAVLLRPKQCDWTHIRKINDRLCVAVSRIPDSKSCMPSEAWLKCIETVRRCGRVAKLLYDSTLRWRGNRRFGSEGIAGTNDTGKYTGQWEDGGDPDDIGDELVGCLPADAKEGDILLSFHGAENSEDRSTCDLVLRAHPGAQTLQLIGKAEWESFREKLSFLIDGLKPTSNEQLAVMMDASDYLLLVAQGGRASASVSHIATRLVDRATLPYRAVFCTTAGDRDATELFEDASLRQAFESFTLDTYSGLRRQIA